METNLERDLERVSAMPFGKVADCRGLIERFHGLSVEARAHPDCPLLREAYGWVFVPLTVWPVDVRGLGLHLVKCIEAGQAVDEEARLLCSLLAEEPPEGVCAVIEEHERAVRAGN